MKQLVAVVLDRDADQVTRALLDQGVMHFVSVTEMDPGLSERLSAGSPRVTEAMIAEIRRRIEGLFSLGGTGFRPRRTCASRTCGPWTWPKPTANWTSWPPTWPASGSGSRRCNRRS